MFRSWFSKSSSNNEHGLQIEPGILLQHPTSQDYLQWVELRSKNRQFLEPWEPAWPMDDLSPVGFRRRLVAYDKQRIRGEGHAWFIWLTEDKDAGGMQLVGGISISSIRRGASQTGTVGYWMGEEFCGRGTMKLVLEQVCRHAFGGLGLMRLQAACLPHNERSRKVLEYCGFRLEGTARHYLEINGTRQDHLVFSRLSDDDVAEANRN